MTPSALKYDMLQWFQRLPWPELLKHAAAIVHSYDTLVTLRQLFYRLVAALLLPNTTNAYKSLSKYTAEARRTGTFPALMDRGRTIHRYPSFAHPAAAARWLRSIYRRDRTEGQAVSLYLGVEKAGILAQLQEWFGDLGVPILALGGYSSWSYEAEVMADVDAAPSPAVLLYAGDHDPSGEDIDRDFIAKTGCWRDVRSVALTAAQVEQYALPPQPGKETDSRAQGFIARHGRLVQVELDALPPDILRGDMRGTIPEDAASPHQSLLDRRTPVADLPEFLSPEEFRAYVGIGRTTIYELLRRGDIPHVKYGRSIRIPKVALTVR